jgi:integrase/recombinase XerD
MTSSLPSLAELLPSWQLAMRAARKAPGTIKTYSDGVAAFLRWCGTAGIPAELTKVNAQAFLADLLDSGAEAATARARYGALRRFAAWLVYEGEVDADPLVGLKPPQSDKKVVHELTDEQLRRLIKACQGKTLKDRRDEAIVRLMVETGLRAGEVIGLQTRDVNLQEGLVAVRRSNGGKARVAPFGPQTATAIDRYIRVRRTHRLADVGPLWVGGGGKTFGYFGLNTSMKERAGAAGIEGFHLQLLRHTAASRWLRAGGSESGLMAMAGWATRDMIDRYTGASASEQAAAEARGLGLGDL